MNIWEILGIPPTTDIVTIKKAYADRAKEWHPEEHPEEFKRLRNAYQTAVKWAKNGGEGQAGTSVEPPPGKRPEPQQAAPQQEKFQQEKVPSEERAKEEEPQPQFSYDDVSSIYQDELAEQFFREFRWIAWNAHLQYRKEVWRYFLLKPDYDDLYCHENFWRKFLKEIYAVPGWGTEILEYFEWWQNLCLENGRKWQGDDSLMNADNKQWSKKKWRCRNNREFVLPASKEQTMEYLAILKTMEERSLDTTLMNTASVATFFKYYEAFMKDNEIWLERQRRFIRRRLLEYRIFWSSLPFLAIILILVMIVSWAESVTKEEEMRKQRIREEAILREERESREQELREEQESREQEEWLQELDERFENMQEQYRDWMDR